MPSLPSPHRSNADFPGIRKRRGLYVDKTPLFRQLLEVDEDTGREDEPELVSTHLFLARPRRFGKSLLISTLATWFQGLPPGHYANRAADPGSWSDLPPGWTSPDWLWGDLDGASWHGTHGWHPVIVLDMSRGATQNPKFLREELRQYLMELIALWRQRGVQWGETIREQLNTTSSPPTLLSILIDALQKFYGQRPVVLVDEYDAPITKHIGTKMDPAPVLSELQEFYRVLKDDPQRLYCVIMTGITRFARDSLFSALNNMDDLSDQTEFAALYGFTEEEVALHFTPYMDRIRELVPAARERDIQREWRDFYNGYRFSSDPSAPRVYNPFTLLDCIHKVTRFSAHQREAAAGRWPIGWSGTGSPAFLARLAQDEGFPLPRGEQRRLLYAGPVLDVGKPPYANLMLETGYYTWRGGSDSEPAWLDFPNREVTVTYARDVLAVWHSQPTLNQERLSRMQEALVAGSVPRFVEILTDFCFGFAYENLGHEASCRAVMQLLCLLLSDQSHAEKHNWGGRADHVIQMDQTVYVLEVKFNRSAAEAWRQLVSRGYGREYGDGPAVVVGIALAFRRDQDGPPQIEYLTETLYEPPVTANEE